MPAFDALASYVPFRLHRTVLADPVEQCARGSGRTLEVKHDGFRFIARRDGDRVRVFSRNAKDWTDRVPLIVEAMLALPVKPRGDRARR